MHRVPVSTYRLQLNCQFGLRECLGLLDYFQELGVDFLYLSPLFAARKRSLHGYDVVNFSSINLEIGSEEDLRQLAEELKKREMGLLLDFVPNHMCIESFDNKWWQDILLRGEKSIYAKMFDIDWQFEKEDLKGKVLAPFLGIPLEEALKKGEIEVKTFENTPKLCYFDSQFPICEESIPFLKNTPELVLRQHYLLSDFHRGFIDLNYRRFFYITDLAALRVEVPQVFDAVHKTLFKWIDKGWVQGLRLDHIDGLYDPKGYVNKLKERKGIYLVAEKILAFKEKLSTDWSFNGTTGYEFLAQSQILFLKKENKKAILETYQKFTNDFSSKEEIERESRKFVLDFPFQPEVKRLIKEFIALDIGFDDKMAQDIIMELLLSFPIYRTYLRKGDYQEEDIALLKKIFNELEKKFFSVSKEKWEAFKSCFLDQEKAENAFVMRFQQTTPSVMAKGIEDTAIYRFFPLLCLSEVGLSFDYYGQDKEDFHDHNLWMNSSFPNSLLATSTHDSKYSADVRCRLSVLTEIPEIWEKNLFSFSEINAKHKKNGTPDAKEEYFIYQTLVGLWPLHDLEDDEWQVFLERICQFLQKAMREAKLKTYWTQPDLIYEKEIEQFARNLLKCRTFKQCMDSLVRKICQAGLLNSLSLLVLTLTSPGVSDIYQGSESWNFSLVDPDNRQKIDFNKLKDSLSEISNKEKFDLKNCLSDLENGKIKQYLLKKGLHFRKREKDLFLKGSYVPLTLSGSKANQALSFLRKSDDKAFITTIGRFFQNEADPLKIDWEDTAIILPQEENNASFKGLFFNEEIEGNKLYLKDLFQILPVSILEKSFQKIREA